MPYSYLKHVRVAQAPLNYNLLAVKSNSCDVLRDSLIYLVNVDINWEYIAVAVDIICVENATRIARRWNILNTF